MIVSFLKQVLNLFFNVYKIIVREDTHKKVFFFSVSPSVQDFFGL